ncbi:MAG: hypothetical protein LW862_05835 [Rubrivivax sp.]|nr:hypothetical protein [Rubrivivax sp.]
MRFLAETVLAEAALLMSTDARLFSVPMTPDRAESLRADQDLAERVDAFVARFGRLQDTLGDKLLPRLLEWLAEPVGPAIDNLARAERLDLIRSGEEWIEARQLRNFMIHEYVRDSATLASALQRGHGTVEMLTQAAVAMANACGVTSHRP